MMVQFPHSMKEKARWIMNFTRQTFLLLGLGGLLAGCVTPTDMGYVTPVEPVYNTAPAYYATPVSGYSTMTVYDGYHPGYGGPRYPHHRPPAYGHGHGERGHGGHDAPRHSTYGGRGSLSKPGAQATRSGTPTARPSTPATRSSAPSNQAGGGHSSSGRPKLASGGKLKLPTRKDSSSKAPSGKGGGRKK